MADSPKDNPEKLIKVFHHTNAVIYWMLPYFDTDHPLWESLKALYRSQAILERYLKENYREQYDSSFGEISDEELTL